MLETSFTPVIGVELEFYLSSTKAIELLDTYIADFGISNTINEEGINQFEVSFSKTHNIQSLAKNIIEFKKKFYSLAENNNFQVFFSSRPFYEQPSSSMQVNISLNDKEGDNVFSKILNKETDVLLFAIGGLLQSMSKSMIYFAPKKECYKRFSDFKNVPTTISWGGNNRTTALRIPTSTDDENNRRIEHRVPCCCSNPYDVFSVILESISFGITNKIKPKTDKIFGNAYDKQYSLQKLPLSLKQSKIENNA